MHAGKIFGGLVKRGRQKQVELKLGSNVAKKICFRPSPPPRETGFPLYSSTFAWDWRGWGQNINAHLIRFEFTARACKRNTVQLLLHKNVVSIMLCHRCEVCCQSLWNAHGDDGFIRFDSIGTRHVSLVFSSLLFTQSLMLSPYILADIQD